MPSTRFTTKMFVINLMVFILCVYFIYNYGQTLNCLIPYGGGLEYDPWIIRQSSKCILAST
jgi:hypothetical protein